MALRVPLLAGANDVCSTGIHERWVWTRYSDGLYEPTDTKGSLGGGDKGHLGLAGQDGRAVIAKALILHLFSTGISPKVIFALESQIQIQKCKSQRKHDVV